MKKFFILFFAIFLTACVNKKEEVAQKGIELLMSPEFLANKEKCTQEKHALSCIYVADAMLNDSQAKKNISEIINYYKLACTFGATQGCDKFKSLL